MGIPEIARGRDEGVVFDALSAGQMKAIAAPLLGLRCFDTGPLADAGGKIEVLSIGFEILGHLLVARKSGRFFGKRKIRVATDRLVGIYLERAVRHRGPARIAQHPLAAHPLSAPPPTTSCLIVML